MNMHVIPNLHFNGNCLEAIHLYEKAFHAQILCLHKNEDADPLDYIADLGQIDFVYHAEMLVGGTKIMLNDVDDEALHISGNTASLLVSFNCEQELMQAYKVLKHKATVLAPLRSTTYAACFVSLIDQFGMRWELITK